MFTMTSEMIMGCLQHIVSPHNFDFLGNFNNSVRQLHSLSFATFRHSPCCFHDFFLSFMYVETKRLGRRVEQIFVTIFKSEK